MGNDYDYVLYIIGNDDYGWYKIGISNEPEQRLSSIQSACPVPVKIVFTAEIDQAAELEKVLHRHFAWRCIGREWFELTGDDLAYIAKIAPAWEQETWEQGLLASLDMPPIAPPTVDGWEQFLGGWFCERYPELV